MRIAVFDHIGNLGGGSKFIEKLLPEIKKIRPNFEIAFYGNPLAIQRENFTESFNRCDIQVNTLKSLCFYNKKQSHLELFYKAVLQIQQNFLFKYHFLPFSISGRVDKEIEKICIQNKYDLVFFPWPFLLKNINLNCSKIGVFHDFNFKYFFGSYIFGSKMLKLLEEEIPKWLQTTVPIVSSKFMADELKKFYPNSKYPVNIIHLAPLVNIVDFDEVEAKKIVENLGIRKQYLIFPTHLSIHKNLSSLFSAIAILKKRSIDVNLVLTGGGTENVRGIACDIGSVENNSENMNIIGLGYVSNKELNALFKCSRGIINPSLYEAGNGPGVDGWVRGIPVLMSDISPFIEHFEILKVRAITFNPKDCVDIANKIQCLLNNHDKAIADAAYSKNQIEKYTWKIVAQKYIHVFEEAVKADFDRKQWR